MNKFIYEIFTRIGVGGAVGGPLGIIYGAAVKEACEGDCVMNYGAGFAVAGIVLFSMYSSWKKSRENKSG